MCWTSHGGGKDQTAIIGHPPEMRDWRPGDPMHYPEVDVTARIEAFVTVDAGSEAPTFIGPRAWLMKHSHVGHDAVIHADVELSPGVIVGGWVVIGAGARVGIGAVLRPGVVVGEGARIGAGAVVVSDVGAGQVWVGCPAAYLRDVEGAGADLATLAGS